jgi:S-DNA-T family DNA segregation ATPase FtsK/SpoIIIE
MGLLNILHRADQGESADESPVAAEPRASALRGEVAALGWLLLALFLTGVLLAAAWQGAGGTRATASWYAGRSAPSGRRSPAARSGCWAGRARCSSRWRRRCTRCAGSAASARAPTATGCSAWAAPRCSCPWSWRSRWACSAGRAARRPGMWGTFVAFYLTRWFGTLGAWLVVGFAVSALTVLTLAWNPVRALLAGQAPDAARARTARTRCSSRAGRLADDAPGARAPTREAQAAGRAPGGPRAQPRAAARGDARADPRYLAEAAQTPPGTLAAVAAEPPVGRRRAARAGRSKAEAEGDAETARVETLAAEMRASEAAAGADALLAERPPKTLLTAVPVRNVEIGRRELDAQGAKLMEALRTFKIDGTLVGRTVGPTVTQFEIEPAPGVKVRQIASLRRPGARHARAEHPHRRADPGQGRGRHRGAQPDARDGRLPRPRREPEFEHAKAALPIALGKDLEGKPVIADLAKMPHLLIAGATARASRCASTPIITSLVYRHTPKSLRFLMVDPKMVELSVYNDLPHMRHKVITDSKDAASVLKWALLEMEERYALLAENGCRNIQDFNRRVRQHAAGEGQPLARQGAERHRLPLERVHEGRDPVHRRRDRRDGGPDDDRAGRGRDAHRAPRAEGARHRHPPDHRHAAPERERDHGAHQGELPEPHRVPRGRRRWTAARSSTAWARRRCSATATCCSSRRARASRRASGGLPVERGDRGAHGVVPRPEGGHVLAARELAADVDARLAAEADEDDILEVIRRREALEAGGGEEAEVADGERDKLFFDAAEVCVQNQGGSTSLLQRRLKIGYGRAARIIDQLHLAGILGPPDGSKPRDVLVGIEDLPRFVGSTGAPRD